MDKLQMILVSMDIPLARFNDLGWLERNIGFRNHQHPQFNEALQLIKSLKEATK